MHRQQGQVKVVKNKVAPPSDAWSWISSSQGISRSASLLDAAVKYGIIEKKGAWYNLGRGKSGAGKGERQALPRAERRTSQVIEGIVRQKMFSKAPESPSPARRRRPRSPKPARRGRDDSEVISATTCSDDDGSLAGPGLQPRDRESTIAKAVALASRFLTDVKYQACGVEGALRRGPARLSQCILKGSTDLEPELLLDAVQPWKRNWGGTGLPL